jgi:hypothetical protein
MLVSFIDLDLQPQTIREKISKNYFLQETIRISSFSRYFISLFLN